MSEIEPVVSATPAPAPKTESQETVSEERTHEEASPPSLIESNTPTTISRPIESPTTSPTSTMMVDPNTNKPSLGEQLYLVHLQRFSKEERLPEDFDLDVPWPPTCKRGRAMSRGEELWEVHCKRMEQCEPDYDEEKDQQVVSEAALKSLKSKAATAQSKTSVKRRRPREVQARILHLRTRDVAIA